MLQIQRRHSKSNDNLLPATASNGVLSWKQPPTATSSSPPEQPLAFLPSCYLQRSSIAHRHAGMLVNSSRSPLFILDSATQFSLSLPELRKDGRRILFENVNFPSRKWELHSAAQPESVVLSNKDEEDTWDACKQALSAFEFSVEEEQKILGKAFGFVHSPYWGEERKKEVPKLEAVNDILNYLRSLSLSDEDLTKLLLKFPEVLGCSLEDELKVNVKVLENEWGINGKSLRNLLLRNPKVLGYNVDCKGDCMAKCTRCWVRF